MTIRYWHTNLIFFRELKQGEKILLRISAWNAEGADRSLGLATPGFHKDHRNQPGAVCPVRKPVNDGKYEAAHMSDVNAYIGLRSDKMLLNCPMFQRRMEP